MSGDAVGQACVAVVIGLPAGIRGLLEARFKGHVVVRTILLRQAGGFGLEPPPHVAASLLEKFADEASDYTRVLVIVLPYSSLPDHVAKSATLLGDLGATVLYPRPASEGWPARPPRLDKDFQDALLRAVERCIDARFPEPKSKDSDAEIAFQLLRGLASHSKMGPNNHSGEDDLWKSRGKDLGPGERRRIVGRLLDEGLLGRKKNDSAGGKGWVYWIGDVAKARKQFPGLAAYFEGQ